MIKAQSIKASLLHATLRFNTQTTNAEIAKFEAQLLLQSILKVNRAWLIAHESDVLSDELNGFFQTLISRRLNGEPIAYILGTRAFYGLDLIVTPDTLIPRPDTETLVETALAKITKDNISVLDLVINLLLVI